MSDEEYEYDELDAITAFFDAEEAAQNPYDDAKSQIGNAFLSQSTHESSSQLTTISSNEVEKTTVACKGEGEKEKDYERMSRRELIDELKRMKRRLQELEGKADKPVESERTEPACDLFAKALSQESSRATDKKSKNKKTSQFIKAGENIRSPHDATANLSTTSQRSRGGLLSSDSQNSTSCQFSKIREKEDKNGESLPQRCAKGAKFKRKGKSLSPKEAFEDLELADEEAEGKVEVPISSADDKHSNETVKGVTTAYQEEQPQETDRCESASRESKSFKELFSCWSSDEEVEDPMKEKSKIKTVKHDTQGLSSTTKSQSFKISPPEKESSLKRKFLSSFSDHESDEEAGVQRDADRVSKKSSSNKGSTVKEEPGSTGSFYKTSEKKRVAHKPSAVHQSQGSETRKDYNEWKMNRQKNEGAVVKTPGEDPWVTEKFSRIRISHPLVSVGALNEKLKERKFVRLSVIKSHVKAGEVEGDWVTMGVIVTKVPPKTSSNGKQFSIWKLNDLSANCPMVALFLFGQVHENLWKTVEGSVVGILNAKIMAKKDQQSDDISITVDNPQKLLILGKSKDLGVCKSRKKNGTTCNVFVNKAESEYCEFHIQKEYKKMTSKRSDLMTSYSGIDVQRQRLQRAIPNNFICNGKMYNPSGMSKKTYVPDNKKVVLKKLTVRHADDIKKELKSDVVTLLAKKSDEDDTHVKISSASKQFKSMLQVPTPGAQNLIRHMVKDVEAKEKLVPISASDLMKQHQQNMKGKIKPKAATSSTLSTTSSKPSTPSLKRATPSPRVPEENAAPCLGRGLDEGDAIDLDFTSVVPVSSQKKTKMTAAEVSKLRALKHVRSKGPLEKVDPNESISKKPMDEEKKNLIMKRTQENLNTSSEDTENKKPGEPAKKRRRFMEDFIDLESEEVQELCNTHSINLAEVSQYEREMQEEYFNQMEKKEKLELKMASIMEKDCKVVSCKTCDYTWYRQSSYCKSEEHPVKHHNAKLRYFKCKDCKSRCLSFFFIPTKFCRNCGGGRFERTSMLQERKVAERDCEKLLIRGEEQKWINS